MATFILRPQRHGLFKDRVIQKGIGSLLSVIFERTLMKVFDERDEVITKKIFKVIPFDETGQECCLTTEI